MLKKGIVIEGKEKRVPNQGLLVARLRLCFLRFDSDSEATHQRERCAGVVCCGLSSHCMGW